eukprot:jgi/Chrzof1/8599/Cz03g16270.t1
MRRRPGIAGLQRDVQAREQFKQAGEEVRKNNLQQMKEQLSTFKTKLEEFAHKYKSDIRRDPVFRAQFHTMCANIGVDPLASNKASQQQQQHGCKQQLQHPPPPAPASAYLKSSLDR